MKLDYSMIGKRIAHRRRELGKTQAQGAEQTDISDQYISNIERAVSIPSTEVIMRLAVALETTPDEFLVGSARQEDGTWKDVAELLRTMDKKQLDLAQSFLRWLSEQELT